jgi:hypothetical protein
MTTTIDTATLKSKLSQFNGSEKIYHRIAFPIRVHYTEGIKYLQEQCECFWLVDAIASYQTRSFRLENEFQSWKLIVEDNSAVLTGDDGNGNILITQEIPYTDFPLPEIRIWVTTADGVFLYLPSEH